jgi:hypothetical protein
MSFANVGVVETSWREEVEQAEYDKAHEVAE